MSESAINAALIRDAVSHLRHAADALSSLIDSDVSGPTADPPAINDAPPIDIVDVNEGYMTRRLSTKEGDYLDYSNGMKSAPTRRLHTTLGCDIEALHRAVGTRVYECEPSVEAINAALVRATEAGGGIVRPTALDALDINGALVRMQDRTILDGSRIGDWRLSGSDRRSAVECIECEHVGITGIRTSASGGFHYGVRVEDSVNVCVQLVSAVERDQNAVRLSTRSRQVTVRYCDIDTGRDVDAGRREQHGIVSSSFTGPAEPEPQGRFGIVYSTSHAYYSNRIVNGDGHSIDCHASNVEVCGNWTDACRMGAKFPHSANHLTHHNRFGGARGDGALVLRFYSANDWAVGVGYECDKLFLFANVFEENSDADIRFDGIHGTVYMIGNEYRNEGGRLRLSKSNDTSQDPGSFNGRVHVWGQDHRQLTKNSVGSSRLVTETDARLQALDVSRMIELMNAPKSASWPANVRHPLPKVTAA